MPLSAKQMEYLALAWQCFESEPKIDYAKFATVAGLASPHSARELMRVTKNKLRVEYGALSSTLQTSNNNNNNNNNTTPQPRTPKKKAAGAAGTASATPASRNRGWKQAEKSRAERDGEKENGDAEDREDAVPEPAKKKARTKAKVNTTLAVGGVGGNDGGVKVKSEFGFEEAVGEEVLGEEEVSIF